MSFLTEILEQPEVLTRTVNKLKNVHEDLRPITESLNKGHFDRLILSGMGGSYALRFPTLIRLNQAGIPAFGVNAEELLNYRTNLITDKTLLLLVSQSGESVETVKLAGTAKARGATLLTITNQGKNSLSDAGDIPIQFSAGEEATVSTKTFTCSLAALTLVSGALSAQEPSQLIQQLEACIEAIRLYLSNWMQTSKALLEFLQPKDSIVLLGRGASLAAAINGGLVMKEANQLHTEGMSAPEYRHGPLEAAGPDWPAIMFIPRDQTQKMMFSLQKDMLKYGNRIAVIGPDCLEKDVFHLQIPVLDPLVSPMAEIVPIHTLAYQIGKSQGKEAGIFQHIHKVTSVE